MTAAVVATVLAVTGVLALTGRDGSSRQPRVDATERAASSTSPPGARLPGRTSAPRPETPAVLTASGFDGTTARYTLADPGTLTLTAIGPCWVEVRDRADAPAHWQATLQPGETRTVTVTTTLWVRLGNPGGIQLGLGGLTIAFPEGVPPGAPINIDLIVDPREEDPWPVPAASPVEEPTSAPSAAAARS